MDKNLIRTRFSRSIRSYDEYAIAQKIIAGHLCQMLSEPLSTLPKGPALEIGCGTGTFTRMLLEHYRPTELALVDICSEMRETLEDILSDGNTVFIAGDAELCPLPAGRTFIASCSVMQWFDDVQAFLARCHDLLIPGGLLALSTFGPDNMQEVASVTGIGLDYPPMEWLTESLTEAGMDILDAMQDHLVLNFPSPMEVLRHLKATGVTGITRSRWTKGRLEEFSSLYRHRFAGDGVTLTYHPIYLIARRPL